VLPDTPADRIRTAFENRPDVLAAKQALEASGIRVVQTENGLLPKLDVFGTYGYSGIESKFVRSVDELTSFDFPAWEVGLAFEFPIGNRAAQSRHRRATLERSRTIAGFESLQNQVVMEVRRALRNLETTRREIGATRKARLAAEAQFEAEVDRVKADQSTPYQLLEVEDDLATAQSQELLAQVAYHIASVDLEIATGTYLEVRRLLEAPGELTPRSE